LIWVIGTSDVCASTCSHSHPSWIRMRSQKSSIFFSILLMLPLVYFIAFLPKDDRDNTKTNLGFLQLGWGEERWVCEVGALPILPQIDTQVLLSAQNSKFKGLYALIWNSSIRSLLSILELFFSSLRKAKRPPKGFSHQIKAKYMIRIKEAQNKSLSLLSSLSALV